MTDRKILQAGERVTVVRNGRHLPARVEKTTEYNAAFPFVLVHLVEVGTTLLVRWEEIDDTG